MHVVAMLFGEKRREFGFAATDGDQLLEPQRFHRRRCFENAVKRR
ncbi:hypothetical protein PV342_09380 [Streptomyces sp. PA03-3a]|nr:hypothetical protein [Streptomyces sp. PA03-3a]